MDFSQKNRYTVLLLLLFLIFGSGCGNFSNRGASSISNYSWRLEALLEVDSVVWRCVCDGSGAPTLVFSEGNREAVSGWTGSNPFEGHYTLTNNEIDVHLDALGLLPAGDSLSIENRFVEFLQNPTTISINRDTLTLTRPDGTRAKFSRIRDN